MNADTLASISATIGGGFFGGLILGYALKKVVKLIAVIGGLFIAGLAYLQYQRLATLNWDNIEGTITSTCKYNSQFFRRLQYWNIGFNELWYSSYKRYICRFCDWIHEGIIKVVWRQCSCKKYQNNSKLF